MACVANKSTTVRKAVSAMTMKRRIAPAECVWVVTDGASNVLPDMAAAPRASGKRDVTPWGEGSHIREEQGELHRVVVRILDQVGGKQHDGLVAGILPPMRDLARLGDDVAGLVHDRHRAVARIFVDLAIDD